jgi:predicted DNA-binding protein (MmcQ/YjbR family)
MATNYPNIWNSILNQGGTQNVDLIASINEDGINHYLEQHQKIDSRIYKKEIKKVFNTQTDTREFVVNLEIKSAIQVQFPPYKDQTVAGNFTNKDKWFKLESEHEGPELNALKDDANKIQVYCNDINISLTWPRLNPKPGETPWKFELKTIKVFAEAFAILKNDQDGYYISLIPTIVKFDVTNPSALVNSLIAETKNLPLEEIKLLDECQDKFTDLFVIALNVLATEQTPKLVRNIRVPVPVIKDRPILPSVFNISENCLTVGGGIDKAKAERTLQASFEKHMTQLKAKMDEDIEKAGGLLSIINKNDKVPNDFNELELKSIDEIKKAFVRTNEFVEELQSKIKNLQKEEELKAVKTVNVIQDAYAIGINEYFFDNIIHSVTPTPKHECSGWLDLAAVRGRACYWVKFFNPDVTINPNASITGAMSIDVGGSIEACVRKFWDCSWGWECGSLAISVKGRPDITIKLLTSNGVRVAAYMGGNLYLDVNLPFPFNKIINAVTSIIGDFVIAMINIVLSLLSFVVIYPVLTVPQQITKIYLFDFSSFNYNRPVIAGNGDTKNKFIGFKGGLEAKR